MVHYPSSKCIKPIKSNSLNSAENLAELRLKYGLPPTQEEQFISCSTQSLKGTHQRNNNHNVKNHNPPTKQLRRREDRHTRHSTDKQITE